jgi:hypothetical protein
MRKKVYKEKTRHISSLLYTFLASINKNSMDIYPLMDMIAQITTLTFKKLIVLYVYWKPSETNWHPFPFPSTILDLPFAICGG